MEISWGDSETRIRTTRLVIGYNGSATIYTKWPLLIEYEVSECPIANLHQGQHNTPFLYSLNLLISSLKRLYCKDDDTREVNSCTHIIRPESLINVCQSSYTCWQYLNEICHFLPFSISLLNAYIYVLTVKLIISLMYRSYSLLYNTICYKRVLFLIWPNSRRKNIQS